MKQTKWVESMQSLMSDRVPWAADTPMGPALKQTHPQVMEVILTNGPGLGGEEGEGRYKFITRKSKE